MKKLTLLLGLLFVVGFAFAQSNFSDVYQEGEQNVATVKQIGLDNEAWLSQIGDGNIIWQCQTGLENGLDFYIWDGNYNMTFQGVSFIPWHQTQFGVCKFFTKQLWDPSNTQHQFGWGNYASTEISSSNNNLVSQTQGWKYHGIFGVIQGPRDSWFNEAFINISGGSDGNMVMQTQIWDNNYAAAGVHDHSDNNVVLQFQYGFDNESYVTVENSSDGNKIGIVQGTFWDLGFGNVNDVFISGNSDLNEVVINQFDGGNFAQVAITGNSQLNDVAIWQKNYYMGSDAYVTLDNLAFFNQMSICQWDDGGHFASIYINQGDYNKIYDGNYGYMAYEVPEVFGEKVYTEIFYDNWQYNVIRQEGYKNDAYITIQQFTPLGWDADYNNVSIYQDKWFSYFNDAYITIYDGSYNKAAIYQVGNRHDAAIDIMWGSDNNIALISQHTDHNDAWINIQNESSNNFANIVQANSDYDDGFNDAEIHLNYHNDGYALINQYWHGNEAFITQEYGFGNKAAIYQKSMESWANIYETGDYNFASICQHHFGWHWANIYIDGNNNGYHNVIEGTSPYFKPSNPGYHNGYAFKVENWVCFDPTNMIRQEGKKQKADIYVVGDWNRSNIYQKGYCDPSLAVNNEAYLHIEGNSNWTAQYQDGQRNFSEINIFDASCGDALTFQVGVENDAHITQFEGTWNQAGIDQFGCFHSGHITQTGFSNEATINQYNGGPN